MKPRKQEYGTANKCGKTIEAIRKERKIKQGSLASAAKIGPCEMSKIEGQRRVLRDYELKSIARVLGVPMEELFNED